MTTQRFTIPFRLPGLNDYINACRKSKYEAARMKAQTEADISLVMGRLAAVTAPCIVQMVFYEADRKRDVDNVESAKKFILDALVKKGVLLGDSPRYVVGAPGYTEYGEGARVEVTIVEDEDTGKLRELLRRARAIVEDLPTSSPVHRAYSAQGKPASGRSSG